MTELLQVRKLSKRFPITTGFFRKTTGYLAAVSDVSFSLQEGEVLGIVGESGSGKSTLARTLLRLTEPTSGSVIFEGEDITHISFQQMKKLRKKMQIVFQNPSLSLNPRKTVFEVIGEVLEFHKIVANETEKKERIEDLLGKVHLEPSLMMRYPHELSIGQKQRIAIARALSVEPKLLVLDECVSALDVSVQAQILNLLQELLSSMRISALFISHDLHVVEHLADRVLVMHNGKVVEEGEAEELLSHPQHPYTKLLISAELPEYPLARNLINIKL